MYLLQYGIDSKAILCSKDSKAILCSEDSKAILCSKDSIYYTYYTYHIYYIFYSFCPLSCMFFSFLFSSSSLQILPENIYKAAILLCKTLKLKKQGKTGWILKCKIIALEGLRNESLIFKNTRQKKTSFNTFSLYF